MEDSELVVTMRDVRAAGLCCSGARNFLGQHNIDLSDFLHGRVTADRLLATGDALAAQVVEVARGRRR